MVTAVSLASNPRLLYFEEGPVLKFTPVALTRPLVPDGLGVGVTVVVGVAVVLVESMVTNFAYT